LGRSERAKALGELVPLARARPSFRSLAEIAELLGADRPGEALELVQNLARIVVVRVTKRLQALDESRAIFDRLEN
jgi:hypothetical protein